MIRLNENLKVLTSRIVRKILKSNDFILSFWTVAHSISVDIFSEEFSWINDFLSVFIHLFFISPISNGQEYTDCISVKRGKHPPPPKKRGHLFTISSYLWHVQTKPDVYFFDSHANHTYVYLFDSWKLDIC